MSYILDGVTLPDPRGYKLRYIEKKTDHDMINNATKRDTSGRKRQFFLTFTRLTQVVSAQIQGIYNQQKAVYFSSTETNNQIASTLVLMDITGRDYNTKGSEYREDFTLVLTEVG